MPRDKQKSEAPPQLVALYDKMVASCPEVERKGATTPYTSFNGHMFSFIHPMGGVALRLPKGVREEFLEKYQTLLFDGYGMVQKEYVTVPESLLEQTDQLASYFALSLAYCKSLKPKKTAERSKS